MGLGITVGVLADLKENDEEGYEETLNEFAEISKVLGSVFLDHTEPTDCETWSEDGYGYTGLHALREVAGTIWHGLPLPTDAPLTGEVTPHSDALFEAATPLLYPQKPANPVTRLFRKPPSPEGLKYIHLICHSDAEGYYVPVDFPNPLIPKAQRSETQHLWPLGSTQRLQREVAELLQALDVPPQLSLSSAELDEALEVKGSPNDPLWRIHPIATYSGLVLADACAVSIRTGAAISFG